MTAFSEALKMHRKRNKLTMQKAADLSGLSKSYICELEHSKSVPSFRVILELCRVYNVEVNELAKTLGY
jgi:transcriptional regulator with XRE-family HTH domain